MEENIESLFLGVEPFVFKNIVGFIEKAFRYLKYDFSHNDYKDIIYARKSPITELEITYKNYYDGFLYLLRNTRYPTYSTFQKFFYIIYGKEVSTIYFESLHSIFNTFNAKSSVLMSSSICEKVIDLSNNESEDFKLIIPLMFMFYNLARSNISMPRMSFNSFENYKKATEEYKKTNKSETIFLWLLDAIKNTKKQPMSYYKKLQPISTDFILSTIRKEKELFQFKYRINSFFIFGSFAKLTNRIDSDIDLAVTFFDDICYESKAIAINEITSYLENIFKRFVDIVELPNAIEEKMIATFDKGYIIF